MYLLLVFSFTICKWIKVIGWVHSFLRQECIPVGCVPSTAVAISPATHAPPPPRHVPPPVDRILDTRLWKHYLSTTTVVDGKQVWVDNFIVLSEQSKHSKGYQHLQLVNLNSWGTCSNQVLTWLEEILTF